MQYLQFKNIGNIQIQYSATAMLKATFIEKHSRYSLKVKTCSNELKLVQMN